MPRGLETVEHGHRDVEDDAVGAQLFGAQHGLAAVRRLTHDLDVGKLGEHRCHALACERLVVGDEDLHARGMVTATR